MTVLISHLHNSTLCRWSNQEHNVSQEAESALTLDHPDICTICEVSETPAGWLYLVMAQVKELMSQLAPDVDIIAIFRVQATPIEVIEMYRMLGLLRHVEMAEQMTATL